MVDPMKRLSTLKAALIMLSLTACTDEGFVRENTFDFIADIGSAEVVSHGVKLFPLKFNGGVQPWCEDERLFCPALPRTAIRFRDVPLGRNPVLHVGLGLQPGWPRPKEARKDGKIIFRVEVEAAGMRKELLNEELKPERIESARILEFESPLPELEAKTADFTFHTDMTLGTELYRPIWCGLLLRSEGRIVPGDEAATTFREVRSLILDEPAPLESSGEAFRADFDEEEKIFLPALEGRLLVTTPPSRAVFRADPAKDAHLAFGIAAAADIDNARRPVRFQVLLDGSEIFQQTITGGKKGTTHRISVPLKFEEDSASRIALCTSLPEGTGKEEEGIAAIWIHPVIEETRQAPRQRRSQGKSVILCVVDALRADRLSCYGYERPTSPNLSRLIEEGVLFENAWSASSWTIPSTATLLTGQYSYTHGLYDAYHWFLVPGIDTITRDFLCAGFATAAFVANHLISEDNNFAQGFEDFYEIPFCSAAQLNRAFFNWLDGREDERFFAYLHYMEPHMPYAAPGSWFDSFGGAKELGRPGPDLSEDLMALLDEKMEELGAPPDQSVDFSDKERGFLTGLRDLYDSEIAYWDAQFARLWAELERRGRLKDTIIVVTSDHGEEFLDHGQLRHGQNLHGEMLHVPLILFNTNLPPQRRRDMAGLVDLAPALLHLAGIDRKKMGARFAGTNLLGEREGPTRLYAETAHGLRYAGSDMAAQRAALFDEWKGILYLDEGNLALYHCIEDPLEKRDLSSSNQDLANEFKRLIQDWVKECRTAAPYNISLFDASALEKLKAMGYLK